MIALSREFNEQQVRATEEGLARSCMSISTVSTPSFMRLTERFKGNAKMETSAVVYCMARVSEKFIRGPSKSRFPAIDANRCPIPVFSPGETGSPQIATTPLPSMRQ